MSEGAAPAGTAGTSRTAAEGRTAGAPETRGEGGRGTFADALARMRSGRASPVPSSPAGAALGTVGPAAAPPSRDPRAAVAARTSPSGGGASTSRATAARREAEAEADRARGDDDPLDPSTRRAAQLAPPPQAAHPSLPVPLAPSLAAAAGQEATIPPGAHASLESLLPSLVKRIAWTGDARRGAVRLELGAGALAGATLLIQSNDGRVDVQLAAPAGVDVTAWRERIARRLGERGLDVGSVIVE